MGESSGELPAMLTRAAAFHDEQIARLSDLVTRLVNPLLMRVMGVVIGGIVVLMCWICTTWSRRSMPCWPST